jgi:hypothetical protein
LHSAAASEARSRSGVGGCCWATGEQTSMRAHGLIVRDHPGRCRAAISAGRRCGGRARSAAIFLYLLRAGASWRRSLMWESSADRGRCVARPKKNGCRAYPEEVCTDHGRSTRKT